LLYRIDIHIDMPAVKYRELRDQSGGESSEAVRRRVMTLANANCGDTRGRRSIAMPR